MLTIDEKITAEKIFMLIDNQSVSQQVGIKLIENYGLRQQQNKLVELQEEYGGYTTEIENAIHQINEKLDVLLKEVGNAL